MRNATGPGRPRRIRLWSRLVAAVLVGFALGTGLHVGRPFVHTPYTIVRIDDAEVEIPWEWVPGLIIHPPGQVNPNEVARSDEEAPGRAHRIAGILRRIRSGLTRFNEIGPGLLETSPAPARLAAASLECYAISASQH